MICFTWTSRAKRAEKRSKLFIEVSENASQEAQGAESSTHLITTAVSQTDSGGPSRSLSPVMVTRIGEQLETHFQVHELPTDSMSSASASASAVPVSRFSSVSKGNNSSDTSVLVNKALLSKIEYLEAEIKLLRPASQTAVQNTPFQVEFIASDNKLVKLYTRLSTYSILLEFLASLVPLLTC